MKSPKKIIFLPMVLLFLLVLAACGQTPNPEAGPVADADAVLSVSRTTVSVGDEVTLSWEVKNASSARLSSDNVSVLTTRVVGLTGALDVRITSSTTFVVAAYDGQGKELASDELTVTARPAVGDPHPNPGEPQPGDPENPDPENPDPGEPAPGDPGNPEPEAPEGLRFDFAGAVGIQLGNPGSLSTASTRSNLYKVMSDGSLEIALVNGTAHVEQFFIRNGKIYVIFTPSNSWDSVEDQPDCVLAEVNQIGEVHCVDASIASVDLASIQFDAHGAIYYSGYTHEWEPVIRKSQDGVATDFYKAIDAITIENFLATRDGSVLLQGRSSGTHAERSWIRLIENGGRITEFPYGTLLDYLPDGTILVDEDYGSHLSRFFTHSGVTVDPRKYCSTWTWALDSSTRFGPSNHEDFRICEEANEAYRRDTLYRDMEGVVALTENGLTRIYPEMVSIPLPLETVTNGAIGLGRAVVAGFDANRNPGALLVDLSTGAITDMLGSHRIEVLRLILRQDENRVLMYGLDHARNQSVLAEYDLRLGILNMADIEQQLADSFTPLNWTANHIPPEPTVEFVPDADFTATVLDGWDVGRVAFDASEMLPATWLNGATWDFGDDTTVTLPAHRLADEWLQLTHEYAEGGNYTVTLTLIDQLGEEHSTQQDISVPQRVPATQVAGGSEHTVVVREDGTVWAWGRNDSGQLGTGDSNNSYVPVRVHGLTNITHIAVGSGHSLAVDGDGVVWAWGYNYYGQLGNGTQMSSSVPVRVDGLASVTHVVAGYSHSLAVDEDGVVWAWGYNGSGQLGTGDSNNSYVPVRVNGLTNITNIAAGSEHSLAVDEDGVVWAWGYNYYGQLGNGTQMSSSVPVRVDGLASVTHVVAGYSHSLAVDEDGVVWAWGHNYYGQLGNGSESSSSVPVRVNGLSNVTRVASGGQHVLAVDEDGDVWAWGYNGNRELGNEGWENSPVPLRVIGLPLAAETVAAGANHSLGILEDGSTWAWGYNYYGQLGNDSAYSSGTPLRVLSFRWPGETDH